MSTKKLLQAAAGSAGGDKVYVEDVFSTYLLGGTEAESGSSVTAINNGLDLSGEGGLVWIKRRDDAAYHRLFDTVRGNTKFVQSNSSAAESDLSYWDTVNVNGFNNNGFDFIGQSTTGITFASWTFRKQKGFFDVKEVTKSSGSNLVVDFSDLGSIGFVAAKYLGSQDWICWSKGMTSTHHLKFNQTDASSSGNYMTVSGTSVTLIDGAFSSGDSVIYAWADGDDSSAQIFGDDGDEAIIKTGSYTGNGSTPNATTEQNGPTVNLGFEPQWLLIKDSSAADDWYLFDTMRGFTSSFTGSGKNYLRPNLNSAEGTLSSSYAYLKITSTGFKITAGTGAIFNENGNEYIYMAIRRGPMKEPSAGTDVFQPIATSGDNPNTTTATFPWDTQFNTFTNTAYSGYNNQINDRLRGVGFLPSFTTTPHLTTANTDAQTVSSSYLALKGNGMDVDKSTGWGASSTTIFHNFRRYPKVFDVVVGKSDASGNVWNGTHNLGANIEFAIVKNTQSASTQWWTADLNLGKLFKLNSSDSGSSLGTDFTTTTTTFKAFDGYLENNENFVMYAFSTLAGISKCGSYSGTGTGTTVDVDCGFAAGARYILIKRSDSSGDWFVYDTARGIVSGDSPYILLNSTAGQVNTDYIDPLSSGFQVTTDAAVTSTLNVSGATYFFLAFA